MSRLKDCVRLIFIGNPLLDITATCDTALLAQYGLQPDGWAEATDQHNALFDEMLHNPDSKLDSGGTALNSAKIAKWATGTKGCVSFTGCVGEDEYASQLLHELRSTGVEPLLIPLPGFPTGTCVCLLSSGGLRSMCTRRGASALFAKEHLGTIGERLTEADCIFVSGFLLSHSAEAVFEIVGRRQPTQIFALNLPAVKICRNFSDAVLQVLPQVDVLLGNKGEYMALAETLNAGSTVEDVASTIARLRENRIVIVSRGSDPVIFVRGKEAPRHFPVPPNVPVLDSVGCGDALAGAFLGVFLLTGNPEEAVRAGIKAAVEIAQKPGCNPPPKKLTDLLNEPTIQK